MNLRICVPIHRNDFGGIKTVLDDINSQDLSTCRDLQLEIVVIANGKAKKYIESEYLACYPFNIYYEYFPEIHNAGQARNKGLYVKTKTDPDAIIYHDYDDNFYSKESLAILVNSYSRNKATITFGDSFVIDSNDGTMISGKQDYSEYNEAKFLINNIIETLYFPFQSALLDYKSCLEIGGFPDINTLEDRILILNLLANNCSWVYKKSFITNYVRHSGTLTTINEGSEKRKAIIKILKEWNQDQKNNLYYKIAKC